MYSLKWLKVIIFNFFKNDRILILSLSFLFICFKIFTREKPNTDELIQIGSAKNFLNGFGFCLKYFNGQYLIFKNSFEWPLFYRVFSLPFILMFKNSILVIYILRIFSFIILFTSFKFFFNSLYVGFKRNLAFNVCALFAAFSVAPFNYGSSIDIISVATFLLIVTFSFKYFYFGLRKKSLFILFFFIILLVNMRFAYVPKVMAFVAFIMVFDFFKNGIKKNLLAKVFLLSVVIINICVIIFSDYFQSTSNNVIFERDRDFYSYWNILYGLFVIPFFSDFTIYNFLYKIFNFSLTSNYIYFVFSVGLFGIIIFSFMVKNIARVFIRNERPTTFILSLLVFGCLINFTIIFIIYGFKTFYPMEKINDVYSLIYSGLALYDRYLLLSSCCLFILSLHLALEINSRFFKALIVSSFIFSLAHSVHLSKKYSISRLKNTSFFSLPEGSYNDMENIYKIISCKENVLFIDSLGNNKINRQLSPELIAQSNGVTLYNKGFEESSHKKKVNYSFSDFNEIIYCDLTTESIKYLNNYVCLYSGNIYSIFKKIND